MKGRRDQELAILKELPKGGKLTIVELIERLKTFGYTDLTVGMIYNDVDIAFKKGLGIHK